MFSRIKEFWAKNPIYLVCTIVYFILTFLLLGANLLSFFLTLIFYSISIFIAFSEFGETILRVVNRVRPIETNEEKTKLLELYDEVYTQVKKEFPKLNYIQLYIIDSMHVNACALGRYTIAITKGAIETFTEEQLKAIFAHEFAHIINLDTQVNIYILVANGLFTILVVIYKLVLNILDALEQAHTSGSSWVRFFKQFILDLPVFIATFLLNIAMSVNSRQNEFRADKFAYDLGYEEEIISALYILEKISLGDNSTIIEKMTASHPRLSLRINRLESLDEVKKH